VPAAAGAAPVRYAVFLRYNLIGGVIWGVGYTLLGYLAGSAYTVIEKRVGVGLAIAAAVLVVAVLAAWAIRKFRRDRARPPLASPAAAPEAAAPEAAVPEAAVPEAMAPDSRDPGAPGP
jgi:membrane-associated protein